MKFDDIVKKLRDAIPDPEKSKIAQAIRRQLGLPENLDPLDPKNWPVPVYGLNRQSGHVYELPLVLYNDENIIKGEITIPVTPMTGDRQEGVKQIVDALPAGDNLIGAIKIQDGNGTQLADVKSIAGFNWLCAVIRADTTLPISGRTESTKVGIAYDMTVNTYITGQPYLRFPWEWAASQAGTTLINIGASVPNASVDEYPVINIHGIIYSTDTANTFQLDYENGGGVFVARAFPLTNVGANVPFYCWSDIPLMTLSTDDGFPELSITTTGAGVINHSLMLICKGV